MTTLSAARPDLENPMVVGEYYEDVPDDYILRNMYPEDAADYVWAIWSRTPSATGSERASHSELRGISGKISRTT